MIKIEIVIEESHGRGQVKAKFKSSGPVTPVEEYVAILMEMAIEAVGEEILKRTGKGVMHKRDWGNSE